jgi:hypothetical protein
MSRSIEAIAAEFEALRASDFDYANIGANGWERMDQLCDEMLALNDPAACAPILFRTMERLDNLELGTPGSLVHTLEKWPSIYEPLLVESIRRKPMPLTVWMINRILNAKPPDWEDWFTLLRSGVDHPKASAQTKAEALRFIKFQTE